MNVSWNCKAVAKLCVLPVQILGYELTPSGAALGDDEVRRVLADVERIKGELWHWLEQHPRLPP